MFAILALAAATASLTPFEGHWRCDGRFIASGKVIKSELKMAVDPQSGVFIVHQDDTAPMSYHSVETWTADPNALVPLGRVGPLQRPSRVPVTRLARRSAYLQPPGRQAGAGGVPICVAGRRRSPDRLEHSSSGTAATARRHARLQTRSGVERQLSFAPIRLTRDRQVRRRP